MYIFKSDGLSGDPCGTPMSTYCVLWVPYQSVIIDSGFMKGLIMSIRLGLSSVDIISCKSPLEKDAISF